MMWKIILPILAAVFAVESASMVGTPGGWADADINSETAQNALKFAVSKHNMASNDKYLSQVAEVVKVQSQVVAGMKYRITVKMGKTPCLKSNPDEVCEVHQDPDMARMYQCTFTVWSKPWLSHIEVLKQEC